MHQSKKVHRQIEVTVFGQVIATFICTKKIRHTMVQSWNLAGVKGFMRSAILFNRHLLQPKMIVSTVNDINWRRLFDEHGIRAVVFDKDNCLTIPYSLQIHESLKVRPLYIKLRNEHHFILDNLIKYNHSV